ncbi:MATE family efflux transporter [Rhodococcus koreensis]|uniref:polysaccharide biosynthesis C-terminal domain-containing protein n=1 Tax=Rhodococcus koreensis TaxID=99653 RepID=UPI0036D9CFC4
MARLVSNRMRELALYSAVPIAGFITAPLLGRALGPDGRGQLAIVLAISALAVSIGRMGQPECLSSDLREGVAHFRPIRARILLGSSVFAALVAYFSMRVFDVPNIVSIVVCVWIPFLAFGEIWRVERVAETDTNRVAIGFSGGALGRALAIACLFVAGALTTVSGAIVAQASAFLSFIALRRNARNSGVVGYRGHIFPRIREALPIVLFMIMTAMLFRIDILALGVGSSDVQVGLYSAAVGLSEASLIVSTMFKARMQAALYSASIRRTLAREILFLAAVSVLLLLGGMAASDLLIRLLYGEQFSGSVQILKVLIFAAVGQMYIDCGQGVLSVLGRRWTMFWSSLVGAVVAIATLGLWVPDHGGVGAAASSMVAYAVVAGLVWLSIARDLGVRPSSKSAKGGRHRVRRQVRVL